MANELPWPIIRLLIAANRSRQFAYAAPATRDMLDDWLDLDLGDRLDRINALEEHPTEDVRLELEGYTETIRHRGWDAQLNAEPYEAWDIGVLADPSGTTPDLGRWIGEPDAAIRAAIDSDDLSIAFDPNYWRWTTAVDDFAPDPLRVRLGGEVVEVSDIATTAATFVAAGTATGADNAAVTPSLPAGVQANDWLFVFAATRGAGTLSINNDYVRLSVFDEGNNVQLFAKVHTGTESAPTVTPSGGSAGDTMTAQMCAFRNMPTTRGIGSAIADARTQLNSSAQNIAYPACYPYPYVGCVVLVLGWKQDDWTSVGTLSGFTGEIGDVPSTDGNDQGLVWDYQIQTTPPTLVDAGSFTVTGGTSQISRSASVAFVGGFQTMTVTARSANGVIKSHASGTLIEVEDALVLGL